MIRYLAEDEKTKSRALWREAFPEDSESFDDYYYTEKIRDNQILVMEEDGKIISMLHLNPYQIAIQKQI
ncbi:MAG: GNAT family N-acetyltransferase, partial [Hungatella sp.]